MIPLLVVWGTGVADALGEQPQLWDGTRVVAGAHSKVWLERMTAAATPTGGHNAQAQHVVEHILEAAAK